MPNFTYNVMCISRYILKSIGGCRLFAAAFLDVMWCVCMYGTWARLKLDWLPCDWPCVVLRYGRMRQVDSDKKRIKKRKKKRERELWLCESARQTINNGLCEFGRHPDNEPLTDGCPSYVYHHVAHHYISGQVHTHSTYVYLYTEQV